tara:strand:- start:643 stop:2091 length:1449 start_codon:yes stop_codon:yes gene_type:complete
MKKTFLSNLVLIIFLNIIVKPFYILGIDAEIINRVGEVDYGIYFSLINLSFIFNIFLDMGLNNFNVKNIAQHSFLLKKYFSKIIPLKIILGFFYFLIVSAVGYFLDYNYSLLFFVLFNQFLAVFLLYLRSNLAGLHLFFKDSIVSVIDRFLLIVFCSFLLWGNITTDTFKISWFIYTQTFSYLLAVIICLFFLLSSTGRLKLNLDLYFSYVILKKSFPYALLIFLMTIYYRVDVIMLEVIKGPSEAGIYAGSFRFFEASNMISYLFAVLLLPIFSKLLKNKKSISEIVFIAFKIILTFSIILCVISIFYNEELIKLRYGNGQFNNVDSYLEKSFYIFPILMLCFLFISCTYIFGTLLTANGNLYSLNLIAFFGMLFNILLNYFLISKNGAIGASLASFCTQFLTAIAQIILCIKIFELKNLKYLVEPILFFTLGVILIAFLTVSYSQLWYINICIFGFLSIIWSFVSGMFKLRYITYIFNND